MNNRIIGLIWTTTCTKCFRDCGSVPTISSKYPIFLMICPVCSGFVQASVVYAVHTLEKGGVRGSWVIYGN